MLLAQYQLYTERISVMKRLVVVALFATITSMCFAQLKERGLVLEKGEEVSVISVADIVCPDNVLVISGNARYSAIYKGPVIFRGELPEDFDFLKPYRGKASDVESQCFIPPTRHNLTKFGRLSGTGRMVLVARGMNWGVYDRNLGEVYFPKLARNTLLHLTDVSDDGYAAGTLEVPSKSQQRIVLWPFNDPESDGPVVLKTANVAFVCDISRGSKPLTFASIMLSGVVQTQIQEEDDEAGVFKPCCFRPNGKEIPFKDSLLSVLGGASEDGSLAYGARYHAAIKKYQATLWKQEEGEFLAEGIRDVDGDPQPGFLVDAISYDGTFVGVGGSKCPDAVDIAEMPASSAEPFIVVGRRALPLSKLTVKSGDKVLGGSALADYYPVRIDRLNSLLLILLKHSSSKNGFEMAALSAKDVLEHFK